MAGSQSHNGDTRPPHHHIITNGHDRTSHNTTPQTSQPSNNPLIPPHALTSRYNRQLLLPQLHGLTGQLFLSQSRVLIIGLGGLGCPAALYLAAAGVGTLGFVDGDVVEESNLHRQVLHTEARVGMGKVESAKHGVREVNSGVRVVVFGEGMVGGGEVLGILEGRVEGKCDEGPVRSGDRRDGERNAAAWDLVLDCTDNPATRYAINDAALLTGVPIVSGAAQRGEGMLMVLNFRWREEHNASQEDNESSPIADADAATTTAKISLNNTPNPINPPTPTHGRGPCYRCIFPTPPDPSTVHSCSEIGVLGTAVGTIGVLMAQEALKLLVLPSLTQVLKRDDLASKRGTMLLFNAFAATGLKGMFRAIGLRGRREGCIGCGNGENRVKREDVMSGKMDYATFCGRVEDVRVLRRDHGERVGADTFLRRLGKGEGGSRARVVDVREEIEVELGAKLSDTCVPVIYMPFSEIVRDPGGIFGREGLLRRTEKSDADEVGATGDGPQEEQMDNANVYFVCHRGNDSQIAAKKLMELDQQKPNASDARNRRWVGDVEGGFVALDKCSQLQSG